MRVQLDIPRIASCLPLERASLAPPQAVKLVTPAERVAHNDVIAAKEARDILRGDIELERLVSDPSAVPLDERDAALETAPGGQVCPGGIADEQISELAKGDEVPGLVSR